VPAPEGRRSAVNVSRETIARLDLYLDLLHRWQGVKNLVGRNTLDDAWNRHVADSIQILKWAPLAHRWIDLGSGGGFPGLVVAIALSEGVVDLIESDHRKCAFLRHVSRETKARARVHCGRIENVLPTLETPEIVTARALAPLAQLLDWTTPLLKRGAKGLFLKGQDIGAELTHIGKSSNFAFTIHPSETDPAGCVAEVVWSGQTDGPPE
jgi:16S rRNA (guanine527-N7)-methyltransferase